MTQGLKIASGDRLGKTIFSAKSQTDGDFIRELFDLHYLKLKGHFAQVIVFRTDYAQSDSIAIVPSVNSDTSYCPVRRIFQELRSCSSFGSSRSDGTDDNYPFFRGDAVYRGSDGQEDWLAPSSGSFTDRG